MNRVGSGSGGAASKDAMSKLSPFWQTVVGIATLGVVVAAAVLIVWGIFFA